MYDIIIQTLQKSLYLQEETPMLKKALSVIVAVVFVLCAALMTVSAADAMEEYNYTEIKSGYEGYKPIPLLVLVISFDADGDGKDAYKEGKNTTVKTSDAYKEQWAHSEESYWANSLRRRRQHNEELFQADVKGQFLVDSRRGDIRRRK